MRVYTREIRMRVHENTHGKMADCTHGRTTEGVLDLCNGAGLCPRWSAVVVPDHHRKVADRHLPLPDQHFSARARPWGEAWLAPQYIAAHVHRVFYRHVG